MTAVWGPSLWHALHTMSFNYPVSPSPSQKRHYKRFMLSLQNVLPCGKCRENLKIYYKNHPLTNECLASRNTFSYYVYRLHESVNKLLGKKSGLSYCDVRELYEHFRASCKSTKKSTTRLFKRSETKGPGCSEPLHGARAKCVLNIVPATERRKTLTVHKSCFKSRRRRRGA